MTRPTILVTGATGKTGAAVVTELVERNWPVRAVVRTNDARSERLQRLGAQTVVADLYDPEQILAAMRGTARAYYCPPLQPFMIQSAVAFAAAAREAKLESVVQMSQWLSSPAHPALMTRQTWLADQVFSMIPGVAQAIVNPGWFADNNLRVIGMAAHLGIFPVLTANSRSAPVSNEDIARAVAAILIEPQKHAGKSYRPTGPALLSTQEMIAVLSRVLKRSVRGVPMPLWLLNKAGRLQGATAYEMAMLRYYIEDHKQGALGFNAPNNDVLELTGQPAEDFETTVRRYAARPEIQPTLANKIREFAKFMWTPFAFGYDTSRYERQLDSPVPASPRFSMQDEHWITSHGSPKHGSPKDGSPKDGSPKDGSPKDGSPTTQSQLLLSGAAL
jgi:uncharacterized protein YbjT (DUF2867 family)